MDKQIELIAQDVAREAAKAVKNRLSELMIDGDKITHAKALAALDEIKEAVNMIRPDLETVVAIKHKRLFFNKGFDTESVYDNRGRSFFYIKLLTFFIFYCMIIIETKKQRNRNISLFSAYNIKEYYK